VIAAAGDSCGSTTSCTPTADLIQTINPTAVLTVGDNAYENGTLSEYNANYDPNWGRFKAITHPATGNHDYHTSGASGYFAYFGAQAPAAYYSFDLGSWHLISIAAMAGVAAGAGSAEEQWLKADLAAHPNQCVLAYWHQPRFSSGQHGNDPSYTPFWSDLYAAGADVVVNGHEHDYERFAPQDPNGNADPARGIREFVAGTGGRNHDSFLTLAPNTEVRNASSFGVLALRLRPAGYDWEFVPTAGGAFTDTGSASCH
jgi:acid phosphatase type 7